MVCAARFGRNSIEKITYYYTWKTGSGYLVLYGIIPTYLGVVGADFTHAVFKGCVGIVYSHGVRISGREDRPVGDGKKFFWAVYEKP